MVQRFAGQLLIVFQQRGMVAGAVAVVVEHGTSGASIASIARDFLDSYFTAKTLSTAVETELTMLP